MPLIIPPGFAQVVWSFTCTGDSEPMVTTCGIDLDADPGVVPNEVANRMFAAMLPGLLPELSSSYTLDHVTVYIGQDGGAPIIGESDVDPDNGGQGGPCPPNTAILVRKRTDLAGRRGRGRFYIPGVPEGNVEANGVINGTYLAGLQAGVDDFYSRINNVDPGGIPYVPVVLHRSEGAGTEPVPTPITLFVAESKVATQRRRLRK